ncbi:MAG: class 1 fructose-bisphosphatase [Hyphomicrobiales bacterium]|nr:class 1 fructose-bisphosphatase [Hyphomicrobiales bacterium]
MAGFPTLEEHLRAWAQTDARNQAVTETILSLAAAGNKIAAVVAQGPLAGRMGETVGVHADGDTQKHLDMVTNRIVTDALLAAPVAWMGSEEVETAVALNAGAPLAVNVDPLDGSSNIETNVSIGTIFSILPADRPEPLLQPGSAQLAAGFIVYGPQTTLALTVGQGCQIFWADPASGEWLLVKRDVQIPPNTREYAVNGSNFRHWDAPIQSYIADIERGADGPRGGDYNMRWVGSLVADAFRILTRGGVYLYPGDARKGYAQGRLRLLYEGAPLAFLVEQAGGVCTDGERRLMDAPATSLHQRTPLVFGSKNEVAEVAHHYKNPPSIGEKSPLFTPRGLFRS